MYEPGLWLNCVFLRRKVRLHAGMFKPNTLVPANTPEDDVVLEDLRQILEAGDSTITIEPEIQRIHEEFLVGTIILPL